MWFDAQAELAKLVGRREAVWSQPVTSAYPVEADTKWCKKFGPSFKLGPN
jgi:hypothetical protein